MTFIFNSTRKITLRLKMTINTVTKVYGVKLLFTDFLKAIDKPYEDQDELMELECDYRYTVFAEGTVNAPSESNEIPDTLITFVRTHDIEEGEKTEAKEECQTHIVIGLVMSHDIINDQSYGRERDNWFAKETPYTQSLETILKIAEKFKSLSQEHKLISGLKPAIYTIYDDCGCCS